MARKVTLALIQMDCRLKDKEYNLAKGIELLEQAGRQQADIACLPELFSTGYHPGIIGDEYPLLAEPADGPTYHRLSEIAKRYHMYIIAPIALCSDMPGVIYNGAIVIGRQGELMGTYNKTHLWALERYHFRMGFEYPVFEADFGKFGVMICYDGGFPEVSRMFALQGAELILCPSAFNVNDKHAWDVYFMSRAMENTCFVAGINRIGTEGDVTMFGNNKIADPHGEIIAEAPMHEEYVLVHTIDLDEVPVSRSKVPFLMDRRQSTYTLLTKEYGNL